MDEHVKTLLGAYMDGELESQSNKRVRNHLTTCAECQRELAGLKKLSSLLRATPASERLSSPVKFTARVSQMLPDQQPSSRTKTLPKTGLWFIPLGLLSVWIITRIASILTLFILTAESTGLLGQMGTLLMGDQPHMIQINPLISLFNGSLDQGIMSILNVTWSAGQILGGLVGGLSWQIILALMYLAWLVAVWYGKSGIINKSITAGKEITYV